MTTPAVDPNFSNVATYVRRHVAGQLDQGAEEQELTPERAALVRVAASLHYDPAQADQQITDNTGKATDALAFLGGTIPQDDRLRGIAAFVSQRPAANGAVPNLDQATALAESFVTEQLAAVAYARARVELVDRL